MTMSYGEVLLSGAYGIANYIKGTSYSFSDTQMQSAYELLHYSYNGAVRGKGRDLSLMGRAISRTNALTQNASITSLAMAVDASHYALLRDDSLRLSAAQPASYNVAIPYHLHYW